MKSLIVCVSTSHGNTGWVADRMAEVLHADAGADSDSAHLAFLQDHGVPAEAPTTMKQTALGICRGFDDGLTFVQVGASLIDRGATAHQAAVEIIGAVDSYCPRNDRALSFPNPATRLVDFSISNGHQMRWLAV